MCIGVVYLCWDVRPIFNLLWGTPPISWLMTYVDPRHPGVDPLHGACQPAVLLGCYQRWLAGCL